MDKSWLNSSHTFSAEYIHGLNNFLDFAFMSKPDGSRIYCPCTKCKNRFNKKRGEVKEHCLLYGFDNNYKNWRYHGERCESFQKYQNNSHITADNRDDLMDMVHEVANNLEGNTNADFVHASRNELNEETKMFFKLLQDAETDLLPGCAKQSKLSFVVRMLQLKALCGWTNKSIDLLLELLRDSFPDGANLPASYYEAQKITSDLGFTYDTIDACPNNYMLFRGKDKDLDKCEICNTSRYKESEKKIAAKFYLPPAPFTLGKTDKDTFCRVLKSVKAPDGYVSNISRRVQVKEQTIGGLKSHDNHILIQQLIPLAVRRALPKNVVYALIELGNFFRKLCYKTNSKSDLEKLQDRIVLTLCHLEKIFPPSFFDIIEHLPIHLADEALRAGLIYFRWMYPIERYLFTLKRYVRNRAHPEASIARGYLMDECMNFCSRYLHDVETKENHQPRNCDKDENIGRVIGKGERFIVDHGTLIQIHRYILANTDEVESYRNTHMAEVASNYPRATPWEIDRIHNETFHEWFKLYIRNMQQASSVEVPKLIQLLADGPIRHGRRYKTCIVRGFRFRTKSNDENKTTQNSGVVLKANTKSYSSTKDRRPHLGEVSYYGVLTDIIRIRYTNDVKFLMFKCNWVDNAKGVKQDDYKFTLVNFNHLLYKNNMPSDEPFILSSQADQVWYVPDPLQPDWNVVMEMTPRDNFDVYSRFQAEPYSNQYLDDHIPGCDDEVCWVRQGVDGIVVDEHDDTEMDEENNDD